MSKLPGRLRQARHVQLGVAGALLMAGVAAHPGLARDAAEDRGGGKQHVAEIEQIGPFAAGRLEAEQFGRLVEQFLVQLGTGRQHAFLAGDRRRVSRPARANAAPGGGRASPSSECDRPAITYSPSAGFLSLSLGAAVCSSTASSSPAMCSAGWSRLLRS